MPEPKIKTDAADVESVQTSALGISEHDDPMVDNIIHTLLVTTNRMQAIPALGVALILIVISGLVSAAWLLRAPVDIALSAGFASAVLSFTDWFLLWMLPRAGQSFGPDRPSALALGVVRGLGLIGLGLILPLVWVALGLSVFISLIAFYSTWIAPFRLGVTHERLHTDRWPKDTPPLRLLHIADLHVERVTGREIRLNRLIGEIKPDVIVFSGDFVNISYSDDPVTEEHIRKVISGWQAPLGVYCVQGTYTVESSERVRAFTAGLKNLRLLDDEWVRIETPAGALNLLGMTTTHYMRADQASVMELAQDAPEDGLRLIVTHASDVIPEADAAGYDLYLCGHTHGGQLRFPFIGAVFSGSHLGMRYVMGRYDLKHMTAYTSRGVGMEGLGAPRARFLCPPEIILWEISGTG